MTLPAPTDATILSIAEAIGLEAAFRLVEERGGARIFVPKKTVGSELARLIGEDAAAAMAREFAGLQIKVPVARVWRVVTYRAAGYSYDRIATRVRCDLTTVRDILKRQEMKSQQLDLFDKG